MSDKQFLEKITKNLAESERKFMEELLKDTM